MRSEALVIMGRAMVLDADWMDWGNGGGWVNLPGLSFGRLTLAGRYFTFTMNKYDKPIFLVSWGGA